MADTTDVLKDYAWTHPKDYGGFSPEGDYVIATRNRDSTALERSNYERILADLDALAATCTDAEREACEHGVVYDWRAGHWAVGWVEYLTVSKHAPQRVLDEAAVILCSLADYPVYDDEHYSQLLHQEATDYWVQMSVRERAEVIRDSQCGASIFAARREELPRDDNGCLLEYLRD